MSMQKANSLREDYTKSGNTKVMHYCPGCGHGNLHNFVSTIIDDLGIQDKTIFISPVGCSVFGYWYFEVGNIQAAHGRAPAVATGAKRANPDSILISYQGDGDLAAIGTAEIIHAANRGENMTVIFVNNAIYGMTGGQMAPTTLEHQYSKTSPAGRDVIHEGYPIRMCELINQLDAPVFIARTALNGPAGHAKTYNAIKKGIQAQIDNKGFSFIEVLSPCPTQWKMDLPKARKFITEQMAKVFPLDIFRDYTDKPAPKEHITEVEVEKMLTPHAIPAGVKKSEPKVELPKRLLVSGFGGQGVMFFAELMAQAAHAEGRNIGSLPSYGPEQRSGTANKSVIISDKAVGSPAVSKPEILVAMSPDALHKFEPKMAEGGLILYNSSVIKEAPKREDIKAIAIPASDIAQELGNILSANMVMIGAVIAATGLVSFETIEALLKDRMNKKGLAEMNITAVKKGMENA